MKIAFIVLLVASEPSVTDRAAVWSYGRALASAAVTAITNKIASIYDHRNMYKYVYVESIYTASATCLLINLSFHSSYLFLLNLFIIK